MSQDLWSAQARKIELLMRRTGTLWSLCHRPLEMVTGSPSSRQRNCILAQRFAFFFCKSEKENINDLSFMNVLSIKIISTFTKANCAKTSRFLAYYLFTGDCIVVCLSIFVLKKVIKQ